MFSVTTNAGILASEMSNYTTTTTRNPIYNWSVKSTFWHRDPQQVIVYARETVSWYGTSHAAAAAAVYKVGPKPGSKWDSGSQSIPHWNFVSKTCLALYLSELYGRRFCLFRLQHIATLCTIAPCINTFNHSITYLLKLVRRHQNEMWPRGHWLIFQKVKG